MQKIKKVLENLFIWYKRNYRINLYITTGLFSWQLFHLYWLTADVVMLRLINQSYFELTGIWKILMALVDYTEIPAIILVSVFYLQELQSKFTWKSLLYLFLINSQWFHLFWITDEVVIAQFTGTAIVAMPLWLSWMAILIDYLELPVIYDTLKKVFKSLRKSA